MASGSPVRLRACSTYKKMTQTLGNSQVTTPTTSNSSAEYDSSSAAGIFTKNYSIIGNARRMDFDACPWIPGETLNIGFCGGDSFQREEIKNHAGAWCEWANLEFAYDPTKPYDIFIGFEPNESWSYIGTMCRDFAQAQPPEPSMNLGWIKPGNETEHRATILHEFGHALGLHHEHQNALLHLEPGLRWDVEGLRQYYTGPPNNWSLEDIDLQILSLSRGKMLRRNLLDLDSIMLYAFPKEALLKGAGNKQNLKLSKVDQATMLHVYPGRAKDIPNGVEYDNSYNVFISQSSVDRHLESRRSKFPHVKWDRKKVIHEAMRAYDHILEGMTSRGKSV